MRTVFAIRLGTERLLIRYIPTNFTFTNNFFSKKALANTQNIVVNKKDDIVTSVMLRNNKLRRKVTVKNISKDKHDAFKNFVYSLEDLSTIVPSKLVCIILFKSATRF